MYDVFCARMRIEQKTPHGNTFAGVTRRAEVFLSLMSRKPDSEKPEQTQQTEDGGWGGQEADAARTAGAVVSATPGPHGPSSLDPQSTNLVPKTPGETVRAVSREKSASLRHSHRSRTQDVSPGRKARAATGGGPSHGNAERRGGRSLLVRSSSVHSGRTGESRSTASHVCPSVITKIDGSEE